MKEDLVSGEKFEDDAYVVRHGKGPQAFHPAR